MGQLVTDGIVGQFADFQSDRQFRIRRGTPRQHRAAQVRLSISGNCRRAISNMTSARRVSRFFMPGVYIMGIPIFTSLDSNSISFNSNPKQPATVKRKDPLLTPKKISTLGCKWGFLVGAQIFFKEKQPA